MMPILIVDDDEISSQILKKLLTSEGYHVTTAADGDEALELIQSQSFRMVVSDWDMPRMCGVDLVRAVRGQDLGGYVYMILLTARNSSAEMVEGMNAGADDFISKPFNPQELLVRIRAGLRVLSLETREMAIFALARLAESRDPETGHHLERVRLYSQCLAQQLATTEKYRGTIDGEFVRHIYQTSPLHDIGKVGIPDCVLLKPGRLNDAEFNIMKTHTTIGAETLDAALAKYPGAKFLQTARDIAATHHERFDGSGYPAGLRGEQIPLSGRIVALADVYDALTSKRVYKPAMDHAVAKSMILESSGSHFDPDIVDAFLEVEAEFISIRQQYGVHEPVLVG